MAPFGADSHRSSSHFKAHRVPSFRGAVPYDPQLEDLGPRWLPWPLQRRRDDEKVGPVVGQLGDDVDHRQLLDPLVVHQPRRVANRRARLIAEPSRESPPPVAGVAQDAAADRAEQQRAHRAVAVRAHHQQVGSGGGVGRTSTGCAGWTSSTTVTCGYPSERSTRSRTIWCCALRTSSMSYGTRPRTRAPLPGMHHPPRRLPAARPARKPSQASAARTRRVVHTDHDLPVRRLMIATSATTGSPRPAHMRADRTQQRTERTHEPAAAERDLVAALRPARAAPQRARPRCPAS